MQQENKDTDFKYSKYIAPKHDPKTCISEEHRWKILGDHFKAKGFVQHQTGSFDHFMNIGIPKIVTEEPNIVIVPENEKDKKERKFSKYTLSFSDVYIPSPTVTEDDRTLRGFYPAEARQRDLTYSSPIYCTVTEILEVDGQEPEITVTRRVVIGRLPIMLRSSRCYLSNMTPRERIKAGECKNDNGGYFIVKGKERVLISQLRSVHNIPLVLQQKEGDKFSYISEVRSMSEETGHSVLVKALVGSDDRTLVFTLPHIKDDIPVGIVFKALGFKSDQFADLIGLSHDKSDKYIKIIINDSFRVDEKENGFDLFASETRPIVKAENPTLKSAKISDLLEEMWEELEDHEQNDWKDKTTQNNALRYIGQRCKNPSKDGEKIEQARQVVENELFPHMGIMSTAIEKVYFLGYMVHKLLATHIKIRKPDNRDDYIHKRVESPGILCYELFKQLFRKYTNGIIASIESKKQLPDAMSIIPRQTDITKGLMHCFATGNWGVPKTNYIRVGVVQILSRLSYGATLSNLRRVSIPIGKESKNSAIRQVDSSQIMFICPSESPEGQPVGIVLNFSLLTRISERFPTVLVKEVLESCENMVLINEFDGPNDESKVFLNGILVGMTGDPEDLVEEIRQLRHSGMLPYDTSVSYTYNFNYDFDEDECEFTHNDNEVHICSDEGRLLRPVFVVEDGKLLITKEDGTDWDTLLRKGCIKYIDNMEANSSVIAFHPNELGKYHTDYCEIAAAMMLGVMASIIPFPDHSQSPRNCYQAAMGKQAMSMFALSHLIRADTVVHVLENPQRPLISTKPADMMGFNKMGAGENIVVAIAAYTGRNQEDSVILNGSAVERGMFWATTYRCHTQEEKRNGYNSETIGLIPLDKRRRDVNYGLLDENGIVRKRHPVWVDSDGKKHGGGAVRVEVGDVIIGKIAIQSDKSDNEELTDCSTIIKKGEEGFVDRIFTSTTPNGFKLVKVVIRKLRKPEVGDKFASRAAQKGTVGGVFHQIDMPFTAEGVTPGIIINPHCIPSRMTINQLMECVLGKACCIEGTFGDATPFTKSSMDVAESLCDRLGMAGYNRTGTEMLYNGMTGLPMGQYFIGPVYYQRLKHLVSDKMHARAKGQVTTMTRQPLEGRSRDGGLRFGEMERDCMIAHGASSFLRERLFLLSDPYDIPICTICGNFATSKHECRACDTDQTMQVYLPYVGKLVLQKLMAMAIKIVFSCTKTQKVTKMQLNYVSNLLQDDQHLV